MTEYRARVIDAYRGELARHLDEIQKYECLNHDCNRQSEISGALCGDCERWLVELCKNIQPTIQRLTIMSEIEAHMTPMVEFGGGAGGGMVFDDRTGLTRAGEVADELDSLASRFAKLAKELMPTDWEWSGYPGADLTRAANFIARQPWATALIYGYEGQPYQDSTGRWMPGDFVRGLKPIFAEIARHWPDPNDKIPTRDIPGIPCPRCESKNLRLHPAQTPGQPMAVVCEAKTDGKYCGWHLTEDFFDWLAKLIPYLIETQKTITKTQAVA